ncbi:Fe-S protein assembly co-chaperone HscB [Candidatus Litorirhabdus singularis]|uniref:Fe-S protein assembly co-chaperone HscB n=1 Tax=Candidatus Litorirhabdus singularis TaxID=2518993 RepID=UPI002430B2B3|nr:Fe-S protein assembly co-chaperone HscB [Candidatus Litorirhabdus singularis]
MDLTQSYFALFDLPVRFEVDDQNVAQRYRALQKQLHPDRHAAGNPQEQRLAVQYSAFVNEAYETLRNPLRRAIYMLAQQGYDRDVLSSRQVDGGFLIQQMDLREKLESVSGLVDPEPVLDHILTEIGADSAQLMSQLASGLAAEDYEISATAVLKLQYLDKLRAEAEQMESWLLEG